MTRRGWHWAGHRAAIWAGALVLVAIYLAIVTDGFTARPGWLDAWNAAKMEAVR